MGGELASLGDVYLTMARDSFCRSESALTCTSIPRLEAVDVLRFSELVGVRSGRCLFAVVSLRLDLKEFACP